MDISFVGVDPVKGFVLKNKFSIVKPVSILIGKNGCGKTRLFEGVKNGKIQISSEERINTSEVLFLSHDKFIPKIDSRYIERDALARRKSLLELFRSRKLDFEKEHDRFNIEVGLMRDPNSLMFKDAHRIIRGIAKKLSKNPSDLSDDEVSSHYDGFEAEMFGEKNITAIFTRYIQRLHDNEYAMWLSAVRGKETYYVEDSEFECVYGRQPWVVLNEILDKTFNGKIGVGIPGASEDGGEYIASFYEKASGAPVKESDLSSGEQTLLWLALVMFSSQFSQTNTELVPKLLLMDEPDAFLHPSMVVQLINFLELFSREFSIKIVVSTHSPTTVALSPENSLYSIVDGAVTAVDKDFAIATLLDGVTQISLSPFNRRLVLVESLYDAEVYTQIYGAVCHRPELLDPGITMTFVSSGPKMPKQQVCDKFKQVFGDSIQKNKVDEFVNLLNGVGSCEQVTGMVESLAAEGDTTVRGLVDWDRKNVSGKNIVVLGEDYAYALENLALDPICIMLLLHMDFTREYPIERYCDRQVNWSAWLQDSELLQKSFDWFICAILKEENSRNVEVEYVSGIKLLGDSRYLQMNGHELAECMVSEFVELRSLMKGKIEKLMGVIVRKSMVTLGEGRFIPKVFSDSFSSLQA
ncbi:ATP-binding protein [Pseudomonas botevensis]|uniref:ATP-binding protein n=1 Tax=Pseudomonas botevensis TaxID=2842352 RepID=UPI001C3C6DA1|nr:ATP-binding protein [Pseudomonas botevensis]MBV4476800.1 ATP-binding protein [Pseudomonas botevensis]